MVLLRRWINIIAAMFLVVAGLSIWRAMHPPKLSEPPPAPGPIAKAKPTSQPAARPVREQRRQLIAPAPSPAQPVLQPAKVDEPPLQRLERVQDKVERLALIREIFSRLAGSGAKTALGLAKHIQDDSEREAALLALLTQWKQGELNDPRRRAAAVARWGLEAGLGLELLAGENRNPELATLWANELTEGDGRTALLTHAAAEMVGTNPAAALALAEQLTEDERANFYGEVVGTWTRVDATAAAQFVASLPAGDARRSAVAEFAAVLAGKDTDAALAWAQQLPDDRERDAAQRAISQVAPVGIGAHLSWGEGGLVINALVPGAPAQLSGQIREGDRIIGVAQGDNSFVDVRGQRLDEVIRMIRGARGTALQLQIVSSDAAANRQPRTVMLIRDQVRYKQP